MKHARGDYDRIQDPAGLIPEDEPVFLIRGQNLAAIPAIKAWITHHRESGGDPELALLAEQQIQRIRDWQREHGAKVADL